MKRFFLTVVAFFGAVLLSRLAPDVSSVALYRFELFNVTLGLLFCVGVAALTFKSVKG